MLNFIAILLYFYYEFTILFFPFMFLSLSLSLALRFLLTALELHTELTESGRELAQLRDFFSNPANFERIRTQPGVGPAGIGGIRDNYSPPRLARTSSVQTFDSLDFARYSDDGEHRENDRVAVLEFDLRAARETIKSLRAALTRSAETDLSPETLTTRGGGGKDVGGGEKDVNTGLYVIADEPIRPHERRTINFLINEHLLRYHFN